MNTPVDSTPSAPVTRRRRIWPWIVALFLAPLLLLGAVVLSFVTLDRDAALLRREVANASGADWRTKVQFSIGSTTLGAVRTVLYFVHADGISDARAALRAVQRASVGVYELAPGSAAPSPSREDLFTRTDRLMHARGWTRAVGVSNHAETVLVYLSDDFESGDELNLCVAVLNGRELIVVSTRLDADAAVDLAARHMPADLHRKIHIAHR